MKRFLAALLFLFLAMLACSFNPIPPSSEDTLSPTQKAEDLPDGANPSPGLLPDPAQGLDLLSRYSQSLTISFTGTLKGAAYQSSSTYTRDVWRSEDAQFSRLVSSGSDEPAVDTLSGVLGGSAYYRSGKDQPCSIQPAQAGATSVGIDPARLLLPVGSAAEMGVETINGISTRHYQLNAASHGLPPAAQAAGELWLAIDGNYVVKYSLHFQAVPEITSMDMLGEQVYEYELTQINASDAPIPPAECLALLNELPVMADARDIRRSPGILDYSSSSTPEQVMAFYENQLVPNGWEMNNISNDPNAPRLIFTHQADKKSIAISIEREGSLLWVTAQITDLITSE